MDFNTIQFLPIGSFLVTELQKAINRHGGKISESEIKEIMMLGAEKVKQMLGPGVVSNGK